MTWLEALTGLATPVVGALLYLIRAELRPLSVKLDVVSKQMVMMEDRLQKQLDAVKEANADMVADLIAMSANMEEYEEDQAELEQEIQRAFRKSSNN
jgi:hypothetical protein